MLNNIGAWFLRLSALGKAGLVLSSLFVVGAVASPASQPSVIQPDGVVPTEVQSETTEKRTITETESVPYKERIIEDSSIEKGKNFLRTAGVKGVRTIYYEITLTNGVQTDKRLLKEEMTVPVIDEVTVVGTYVYVAPPPVSSNNCDPNYSGGCVPIASDVDCGGGSGNGPAYFYGTARVVGYDIYDLDRDNDGLACE